MPHPCPATAYGLIIIGNEILDGRRTDAHFHAVKSALDTRHLDLDYVLYLPDTWEVLCEQLGWAMRRPVPFFCCGGIGSTPDDLTRQAAAAAGGVELARHPDGVVLLKQRFDMGLTEHRLRMVDFPAGATLIPNPVNQVPGFSFRNGHFVPGFPEMAHPMIEWVLEQSNAAGRDTARCTFALPGAKEADLVDIMNSILKTFPTVQLSSLPHLSPSGGEVLIGLKAVPADLAPARVALRNALADAGLAFQEH